MGTFLDNPLCGVMGDNMCSAILAPIFIQWEDKEVLKPLFESWDIEDLRRHLLWELHLILSRVQAWDGNMIHHANQTMVQWDLSNIVRQSWLIIVYWQKAGVLPETNDETQMQQLHADMLGVSVEVLKTLPIKSPLQIALERLMDDE